MTEKPISRRALVRGAATLAAGATLATPRFVFGQTAPAAITPEAMRPQAVQGLQIGDVSAGRAIVPRAFFPEDLLAAMDG